MQVHDVTARGVAHRPRKRVGRGPGSGHGRYATRGCKGQRARSGDKPRPGFEGGQMPLYRRVPKRGFSNERFRTEYAVVNVADLNRFEDGAEVDLERLAAAGLARASERVKVLGGGALARKLTVRAHKFSASARAKIEAAGGTVATLD